MVLLKVTDWLAGPLFTFTVPDDGLHVYPLTDPTVNAYVPFGSWKVMVDVVELRVLPFRVTDQDVPEGRPLSVKVTEYFSPGGSDDLENVTATVFAAPFTVTLPEEVDTVYPVTAPTV